MPLLQVGWGICHQYRTKIVIRWELDTYEGDSAVLRSVVAGAGAV